jgi:hypothetical protein
MKFAVIVCRGLAVKANYSEALKNGTRYSF